MKILAAIVAIAFAVTSPALAATKQKKKPTPQEVEAAKIAEQHDNTRRFLRDGLPLVLPTWSLPIFFGMHMDEKLKEGDKKPAETKQATKKQAAKKPR